METLSTFTTRVASYARTPNGTVSPSQLLMGINDAIRKHSCEKPQSLTTVLSGSSPYTLTDTVPTWGSHHRVDDVFFIEGGRKSFLSSNEWSEFFDGSSRKLLISSSRGSGNRYLVFTAPHTMEESGSTLALEDLEFVGKLAAANACDQAAAEAADHTDPVIGVDTVNYQSQIDNWRKLARGYRKEYNDHVARPAGQWVEWDIVDEQGNPPLFHGGANH